MSWTEKRRMLESWTKLEVTPLLSGTVRDIEWEFDGAHSVVLAEDPNGNKTGSSATVNMNRRYANELETGEACRLYSQICTIWAPLSDRGRQEGSDPLLVRFQTPALQASFWNHPS